MIQNSF